MEYTINEEYPSIEGIDVNLNYGQMLLTNLGGLHSEMSATSLYFYNQVILEPIHKELSQAFKEIAMVEMLHLEIFSKLCYLLGVDPRLWDCQNDFLEYWSPGYNVYPRQVSSLLENAILQEKKAIQNYQYQMMSIPHPVIQNILSRIIKDEQYHIQIFEYYLNEYHKSQDF